MTSADFQMQGMYIIRIEALNIAATGSLISGVVVVRVIHY